MFRIHSHVSVSLVGLVLLCNIGAAQQPESQDKFEARVGWEVHRQSLVGILGYVISLPESWAILPELHIVAVLTPSVSLRREFRIYDNVSVGILGGVGVNFPPSPPPITGIAAISMRLNALDRHCWSLEVRLIAPAVSQTTDNEVGGTLGNSKIRSLRKYPPLVVSIGFEF